ncbi:hypothetical protein R6Q59_023052 [Mikania micrantha]
MASSSIQAGAGTVQAVASAVDTALNLGNLTLRAVEASTSLQNSHSCMEAKMVELRAIIGDVKNKFQTYWFPRKKFDLWLSAAETIDREAGELTTKVLEIKETSDIHFYSRLNLIPLVDAKGTKIDQVIKEGKELEDALVKRETRRIVKLATPISIAKISSLNEILEQLIEYLKDQSINTIRLHGAAGTGKKVLIQHLNNHEVIANNMFDIVLGNNMFDVVLWLPASDYENGDKSYSREASIQLIIARRLGLEIGGIKDVNVIASKIHAELDDAKYLLLLDDVKANIDLETIGIPRNTKGSKIVFTTNLPYVCPFRPFFNIKIGRLSEGDSWQMFEDILIHENDTIQQHEIGIIALKVVKWCDGLFSLIKIVAENFKSKRSPQSWSDGLQMLRRSAKKGDIYMQALENFLHFSFGGLEENQKLCFLFTLLYPEGNKIPIDCLFDCWTTHKFVEYGVLEKSSVTGQDIMEHLLAMALLNEGSNKQYVTIDRVFRAAAMKILKEHDQFKCLVAQEALEKLQNNHCEDIHWISLANGGIDVLPTEAYCPKLTTLLLQNNSKLKTISSSFFDHMNELLVLDLYKTGFESMLPMSKLKSFKVLYVNSCAMLKELPFKIDGLDNMLEVLDIRGCIINEIPRDIKRLKHLRRLMVSINGNGTMSHLMLFELSSLKELIIDVKSDVVHLDADAYMSWCNEVIGDVIEKVDNLKELTMLKFCFKDDIVDVIQVRGDTLKIFVPKQGSLKCIWKEKRNLNSSAIQVYIGFQMSSTLEIPKCFYSYDNFVLSCDKLVIDPVIEDVLVKVKTLIMLKDNSVEHLDQIGISNESMNHINSCLVQRCNKIETIMQSACFSNLETLVLNECSQLKVLFSKNVSQHLASLKHLEIRDCSAIEEINMLSTSGGDILPKLTTLVLHNLRMLAKICSDMKWPLVSTLQIHGCPKLAELPLNENSAKNLCVIKVEKMWWGNLQLGHEIKRKFERYCKFSD